MSVTLTGGPFTDAHATAVASGTLRLQLSKDARRSGGQVCRANQVDIPLDVNGSIASNTTVYGNDELTPTDTYYVATVFDSNRSPVYGPVQWLLTGGGTVNVNTINPTTGVSTAGVSITASLDSLSFDRANQDVTLSRASAGVLQLNTGGSFNPQTDAQAFGSSVKRWIASVTSALFYGATSGSTTLQATATASGTLTLPAATDTLVGKTTTDTLTNKTLTSPVITAPTIDSNAVVGTANRLLHRQAMVRVTKSAAQTLTTSTFTAIAFDGETFDTDTLHDNVTNNSRLTASVTGKWFVEASVGFVANTTGQRALRVMKNGTTYYSTAEITAGSSSRPALTITALVDLAAGDYVEIIGFQDSGGNLNVDTTANDITHAAMFLVGV
jgi:hypothetical protein